MKIPKKNVGEFCIWIQIWVIFAKAPIILNVNIHI